MFDRVTTALRETEAALAEHEPNQMIGTQPAAGLELLGRHERVVAAARMRLTARAEEMNQWPREGYRSFEEWLAATFGTGRGQARRRARAARNVSDHDDVADALADGQISEDQADVVADAADKNPDAEGDLLDTARNKHKSHDDLKDEAAEAKAAGEDDRRRADRLRRGRTAGWGPDRDGWWGLSAKFQPEVGAEIKARLEAEVDRILTASRHTGTREPFDRYRADALAALILGHDPHPNTPTEAPAGADNRLDLDQPQDQPDPPDRAGTGPRPAPAAPVSRTSRELILDINLQTLRRGCVHPGETCHIRGVGPVPVEIARRWVDDAFVKTVIRDGHDIKTVAHYGRHIPTHLRTALALTDTGCAVPRCSNPRIDYDHHQPHADHGPTSLDNLRPLCAHHHRQRTHHHHELHGDPGDRRWTGPDGQVLFADNTDRADNPDRAPGPGPSWRR